MKAILTVAALFLFATAVTSAQDTAESRLLSASNRILERTDSPTFAQYLAVESLLTGEQNGRVLASSGLLQFRRLQLMDRAAHRVHAERLFGGRSASATAWAQGRREFLSENLIEGGWYLLAEAAWKRYERFKREPWSDELAWFAAQLTRPTDECMSNCVLQRKIIEGPLQYWNRLPNGANIDKALERAASMAEYTASIACYDGRSGRNSNSPVPPDFVREIRDSLRQVTAPGKQAVLRHLEDAERKCATPR
jgi:hypothetical protein